MDLVTLGTGTLTPQPHRGSASFTVVEGEAMLGLDFGRNALARMTECDLDPLSLSQLLLTHVHPDHCCELVSLLFARNYVQRPDGSDPVPLRIGGPVGVRAVVEGLQAIWPWLDSESGPNGLSIQEWQGRAGGEVPGIDGFEVRAWPLSHGNTVNLGYRITSRTSGRSIAYTGDTGPCTNLVELARGVDLLLCECAWPGPRDPALHLWPAAVGEAAAEAGVGHLVLTHFYPETDPAEARRGVERSFPGEVSLAHDGGRWTV